MKVDLYAQTGEKKGEVTLKKEIFEVPFNEDLVHQALVYQLANARINVAHTKSRGEVRGGGPKPFRQKGTGRARVGSIRNPIWRGGGVVFGPKPRKIRTELNKKVKSLALIQALNAKLNDGELIVVEKISFPQGKTKEFATFLKAIKANRATLVVIEKSDEQTFRAGHNIDRATIKPFNYINVHDVLKNKKIVFAKEALENLIKLRKR